MSDGRILVPAQADSYARKLLDYFNHNQTGLDSDIVLDIQTLARFVLCLEELDGRTFDLANGKHARWCISESWWGQEPDAECNCGLIAAMQKSQPKKEKPA